MIVDTENEPAEPLISPELAAELGLEEGTDLVLAGKKKKKHKSDEPSEEVKTLAKQLSKKAQKRIAQITQRKEKEAKQADFLSTIHDHEISEEHRQLLTSTRDINQSQTMKQLLSSLYKKQAAGLTLSTEESQLLYNTPRSELEARFATSSLPVVPEAPEAPTKSTAMEVVELHPNTPPAQEQQHTLSFDDIIPQSSAADLEAFQKNKKSKKKSGNKAAAKDKSAEESATDNVATVAPTATVVHGANTVITDTFSNNASTTNTTTTPTTDTTTTPAVSLGSGLLAQLKRIKEGNSNSSKNTTASYKSLANAAENSTSTTTATSADSKNNSTTDNTSAINNTTSTYTVHATALPVDAQGGIVKANTSTKNSTTASSASNNAADVTSALNKARTMGVERSAEVQAARMELPVCHMEQEIIEAIRNSANDTIILCGETGSGKSTQVPQFLYENGFGIGGMIGITQPRRVAVTSTAERVSYEMTSGIVKQEKEEPSKSKKFKSKSNTATNTTNNATNTTTTPRAGQLVGYQIRFDSSTVGADTKIKFMTDGILLKEVAQDLLLRKYRVVILDEAHERNINTDVLLGMLSKVLPLRRTQSAIEIAKYNSLTPEQQLHCTLPLQPLKLIIMSATMRVNDFQNPRLFQDTMPPIIKVEARQYPVTTHFSKRTETVNYLKETHKKVCQIHKKLPEGGVLVFLSGKQEIFYMCHKLARSLNKKGTKSVVGNSSGNSSGSSVVSGSGSTNGGTDSSGDSSIDVVGLGASAEELMEQQEGPDITALLNTNTKPSKHNKHNKKHTTNTATTTTDTNTSSNKLTMRDILNQDEIDTDSESEIDSDYSDSDSDDEGSAMNTTNTTTTTTTSTSSVVPAEEEIFILDGDDNAKKRTKHSNNTVSSRISSTTSAMVTGNSVRDQLLKEALGIDPTAISSNIDDTISNTNTTNTATNNTTSTTNNTTSTIEEPNEPTVPELRAYILPLYALMPAAQQNRVFLPVPPGHRLIVVATNVAETSITIPGIRYVVDSGRQKEKVMTSVAKPSEEDEQATSGSKRAFEGTAVVHKSDIESSVTNSAGIAKYEVRWVSQAAASQRSGRAGRTGPGHCYRLYSANFYHEYMKPYQPPEITVTPLEELILQMKALGIDHIERFPFPTPPPATSIKNAITLLTNLGAIAAPGSSISGGGSGSSTSNSNSANKKEQELSAAIAMATMQVMKSNSALHHKQLLQLQELQRQQNLVRDLCPLTQLGKVLAKFPLNPRFAKMLVMAFRSSVSTSGSSGSSSVVSKDKYVLLSHALTMVATLAERSAFDGVADTTSNTTSKKKARTASAEHSSDDSASEDEVTVLAKAGNNTKGSVLYYHEDGDALARLRATGAYIHTVLSAIHSTTSTSAKNKTTNTTATNTSTNTTALYQQLSKSAVTAANESSSVRTLCSVHKLHAPTLQRIVELREQLQDISASVLLTNTNTSTNTSSTSANNTNTKSLLDVPLAPPSAAQELALRQLLVSGFCDCIARRVPLGVIKTGARRRRLCAYYSSHPALQDIPLYIHPGSNIYNSDPTASLPEYITYQHLVRNQRGDCVYMTCCSVVNPLWLSSVAADCPLLKWSEPILTPVPYYDSSVDSVMCYVVPKFGVNSWDLPAMRRSLLECSGGSVNSTSGNEGGTPFGFRKQDEAYRWFARLLLEGSVFSPAINNSAQHKTSANSASALSKIPLNTLKEVRSALNKTKIKDSSASVVTQMKPIPKVSNLLRKLVTREVCSLSTLLSQLHSDHTYLLEEILEFVNPEHRREFRAAWAKLATTTKTSV